jgi:histidinol dehydrogenase
MSRATEKSPVTQKRALTQKRAVTQKSAERPSSIEKARLRYTGALSALSPDERAALMCRTNASDSLVREQTEEIVRRVRSHGDRALREMAVAFDGVALDALDALEVPRGVRQRALAEIDPVLRSALEHAAWNITLFHSAAPPRAVEIKTEPGVTVGRRPDPLQRVGIYSPGGRAAYASSVLMAGIPAKVARVSEIILCSPPQQDGYPAKVVLAACEIAGVDRVFALGGAGAIAAMAYGTESVPRVDRIVGPGNAYVAEAKLQVSRDVGIDSPAGPSELLVICDGDADVETIAREVVAQAEHDVNACVVVVALDNETVSAITEAIEQNLPSITRGDAGRREMAPAEGRRAEIAGADGDRADIARGALEQRGAVLYATSLAEAVEFAAEFAPEHLLLAVKDAERVLPDIRNAGCVFVGEQSSVVFGDYITGGNHVLPTGGLARSYSGLGPLDFVRWTSYQKLTRAAARRLSADTAVLANAEGLPAHAAAALGWSDQC